MAVSIASLTAVAAALASCAAAASSERGVGTAWLTGTTSWSVAHGPEAACTAAFSLGSYLPQEKTLHQQASSTCSR